MDKYKPKDSVSSRVAAAQDDEDIVIPPTGVKINSKEAKVLWQQYTASRPEWSETHLVELGRIVHLEIGIRAQSRLMAKEELVITTRLGELKENPRAPAIDRMVKQKAMLMRVIGLSVTVDEATKMNRSAKKPRTKKLPASGATVVDIKEKNKDRMTGAD
jgi:hypothetical protein